MCNQHDELADLTLADMLPRYGARFGIANHRMKYAETNEDVVIWMPSLWCVTWECKVTKADFDRDAFKRGVKLGDERHYVCPVGVIARAPARCGLWYFENGEFTQIQTPEVSALDDPDIRPSRSPHVAAQMRLMLHLLAQGERKERAVSPKKKRGDLLARLCAEMQARERVKFHTAVRLAEIPARGLEKALRDHPTLCIKEESGIRYVESKGETQ